LLEQQIDQIGFVDIDVGIGIWSKMVAEKEIQSVTVVELNDDLRAQYGGR
jgi:hypothetical protein